MPLLVPGLHAGIVFCASFAVSLVATSAVAQEISSSASDAERVITQNEGLEQLGRTAETGVGEVGQRLTRWDIAPNIEPMARVNRRIENRVENRLTSRIDTENRREADANSAFEMANRRANNPTILNNGGPTINIEKATSSR